ncbi:MAG: 16S rRNA (cytidine(1402)-2'-O)-methyltransferase [Acidimicrobiales bacterium]
MSDRGVADPGSEDSDSPAALAALVLVATPIGNLGDLSPRASAALGRAEVLFCEDTRRTRKLLSHAGIHRGNLRSLNAHNEADRIDAVLGLLDEGRTVAVVTDAGMPGVSDPGARVVAAAAGLGHQVTVVPGPSAPLAALVISGLATDRFCFEGFLPRSGTGRRRRLEVVSADERTTILFEAPGRVAATLADLVATCGGRRPAALVRELTKVHEEVWRGPLDDLADRAVAQTPRGEVVIVLGGAPPGDESVDDQVLLSALIEGRAGGRRTREVVDLVAERYRVSRRRVYGLALSLRPADIDTVPDRPR